MDNQENSRQLINPLPNEQINNNIAIPSREPVNKFNEQVTEIQETHQPEQTSTHEPVQIEQSTPSEQHTEYLPPSLSDQTEPNSLKIQSTENENNVIGLQNVTHNEQEPPEIVTERIREVPVENIVEKEVIKEIPIEKILIKEIKVLDNELFKEELRRASINNLLKARTAKIAKINHRKSRLSKFIQDKGEISSREIQLFLQISPMTAWRYTKKLLNEGKIKSTGKRRSRKYSLN